MRICTFLFFGFFLLFVQEDVFGQVEGDTLGLTGTMADTVVANRLLNETIKLIESGKYENAYNKADGAEQIYVQLFGFGSIEEANVLHQKGRIFDFQIKYDSSINSYIKSLDIRLKNLGTEHLYVALSYNSLGVLYDKSGRHEKAIEYFQKALQIRQKILGLRDKSVAQTLASIGIAYYSIGKYAQSIDFYQRALSIFLEVVGPDHLFIANCYNNLGNAYNSKGDYDIAIEYHKKSLNIRLNTLGAEHPYVAQSYNNIGNTYDSYGDYNMAIKSHQGALIIYLKAFGPEHPAVAQSYNNMGISFQSKGDFDKAINYHKKALDIWLKVLGPDHPDVAYSFNNLGNSYGSIGDFEKSIACLQNTLEIRLKALGLTHVDVATTYLNLGVTYDTKKDYKKSIEYHKKSITLLQQILGDEHPYTALCNNNIGYVHMLRLELKEAIKYFENSIEIYKKNTNITHPDKAKPYNNLGQTYKILGDYGSARVAYQNALEATRYRSVGFGEVNSMTHLLIALLGMCQTFQLEYLISKNDTSINQSYDFALQALAALDYQQSTFSEESTKSFWQSQNYPIYEQAIDVSLLKATVDKDNNLQRSTFTYAEKSKASLLQAQIKSADAINFANIPDSLLQREHNLRIDLTWREKQRQGLLDKGLAETDTTVLHISSILFDLKRDYETLIKRFETDYPDYYRLKYDRSTVSLQYVQDTLLSPTQTLLEYFTGDSAVYLFAVRPDSFAIVEVKRGPNFPLDSLVRQLRYGLTHAQLTDSESKVLLKKTAAAYAAAAAELYRQLVAPVAGMLTENVIIVPDGVLGYIPFDALLTQKPADPERFHSHAYFGKEKKISYAYSATLLREMRDKKHKTPPMAPLMALAPFFRGNADTLREHTDELSESVGLRRDTLTALPASGQEVKSIAKIFNGKALYGADAPKETLLREAGKYRILHLSTHGKANDKVGDYAYLAFSVPGDTTQFDKFYVRDIYNLALNADLVTLSACETGIGELKRGEGIISLARAFAYAGAKSIVTSLWVVKDDRTAELMRLFYQNLQKKGWDKDRALWQAKNDFIAKHKTDGGAHPYYWAGFVPVGDMGSFEF